VCFQPAAVHKIMANACSPADVECLLRGIAKGSPLEALGLAFFDKSAIRRKQASFHPDKQGDTLYSQLANACADALSNKGELDEAHIEEARRILWERDAPHRRAELDREFKLNEWCRRYTAAISEHNLAIARRFVGALEVTSLREASRFKDVKYLAKRVLLVTCQEARWILDRVGVHPVSCRGTWAACKSPNGLRIPTNTEGCAVCGFPGKTAGPLEERVELLVRSFQRVPADQASKYDEIRQVFQRAFDVGCHKAGRLMVQAGLLPRRPAKNALTACFADTWLRVRSCEPSCVMCGFVSSHVCASCA
jgi:hypothetical protein